MLAAIDEAIASAPAEKSAPLLRLKAQVLGLVRGAREELAEEQSDPFAELTDEQVEDRILERAKAILLKRKGKTT
jgi:hypothetical protein